MPPIIVPLDAKSTNPINYQLSERVRRECENVMYRGNRLYCPPESLGVDATGDGAGLVDVMQRIWSPNVRRVGFGESPSEDQVSHEDVRPASEVFRNRRAEMYFRARAALDAKQLRGFDPETAQEICTISFDDSKSLIVLVSKIDYKKQFGCSPDLSDSVVVLIEVARRLGFKIKALGHTIDKVEVFDRMAETTNAVYATSDFAEEEVEYELYRTTFNRLER